MTTIIAILAFYVGMVAGFRILKIGIKAINSLFDKIEEKL